MSMRGASLLLRVGGKVSAWLGIVVGMSMVAAIVFVVLDFSLTFWASLSIYIEIIWAISITACSALLIGGTYDSTLPGKFPERASRLMVVGLVVVTAVAFAGAVAALAFALAYYRPAEYADGGSLTPEQLYAHFLWRFVDLIPGLEVWKVIAVADPAHEAGLYAGALLIAYKAVIIAMFFETLRRLLIPVEERGATADHDIVSLP